MLKTFLFGFCVLLPSIVSATSHWLNPRTDFDYNVSKRVEVFREAKREIIIRRKALFQVQHNRISAQQEKQEKWCRSYNKSSSPVCAELRKKGQ